MPVAGSQRQFGGISGEMGGFENVGMPRSPPKNKSESMLLMLTVGQG